MNFTQDGLHPERNYSGIAVVLLLHVALIYALVNGLAQKVIEVIQQPVETQIIKEIPPPVIKKPEPPKIIKKAELPPPPKVEPPPVFRPKVEVKVAVASVAAVAVTEAPPPPKPVAPPPAPEPAPVHTAVSTGARSGCAPPQYPADAQENGEQGTVRLALLIGTDGKVVDTKVEKSSGSKSLDRAAQKALSLCTFKPATTDGKPVQDWGHLSYVWNLA
jgi:protein TonB